MIMSRTVKMAHKSKCDKHGEVAFKLSITNCKRLKCSVYFVHAFYTFCFILLCQSKSIINYE